jgi:hypothetical protein
MHDSARVCRFECGGDLQAILQHARNRQRSPSDHPVERLSLDELHDDERVVVLLFDVVDGDDVRMIQRRGCARFVKEPAQTAGVDAGVSRQRFDRDGAAQTGIRRPIDHTHAAAADFFPEAIVRRDVHRCGGL